MAGCRRPCSGAGIWRRPCFVVGIASDVLVMEVGAASSADFERTFAPDTRSVVVFADGGGLFVLPRVSVFAGSGCAHGPVVAAAAVGDGVDTGG